MLHIILGILKVIGIILAAVILLLLGTAFAVLFVPVRYKGSITKTPDQVAARIRVTWLFRLISVLFAYDHGQKKKVLEIRIFGVSLESIQKFIKKLAEREEGRRRKKEQRAKQKELRMKEKEQCVQENELQMLEREQRAQENELQMLEKEQQMQEKESHVWENVPDSEDSSENKAEIAGKPETECDSEDEMESDTDSETESSKPHKKFSLSEKLQNLKCKLLSVWETAKNTIQKVIKTVKQIWNSIRLIGQKIIQIPEKISQLLTKLAQIPEKISDFQKLLEKYEVKEVLQDVWKEVKHLLRCYGPRRISGYLKFGTGDPAKTGQLLGVMYILLPAKADKFSLEPDFTEAVFETDMHIKGHIRVNHAAAAAWRLFRNKKLRRAIKGLRKERRK